MGFLVNLNSFIFKLNIKIWARGLLLVLPYLNHTRVCDFGILRRTRAQSATRSWLVGPTTCILAQLTLTRWAGALGSSVPPPVLIFLDLFSHLELSAFYKVFSAAPAVC